MDISDLDIFKLNNLEPKIINIINDYVKGLEQYELYFFNNLPEYVDESYLNLYFNCDFTELFKNTKLTIIDKINILKKYNLEVYDIQNSTAITIIYKNKDKKYYYKWDLFKSIVYEDYLNTTLIRNLKNSLILSITNSHKKNEYVFTLDEIINMSMKKGLCLHCIGKDYVKFSLEKKNLFVDKLKKKLI